MPVNRLTPSEDKPDREITVTTEGMSDGDILENAALLVRTSGLSPSQARAMNACFKSFVRLRARALDLRAKGAKVALALSVEWEK